MKSEKRLIFTNLNFKNWENLILFGIFLFYIIQLGFLIGEGAFPIQYGEDFLASGALESREDGYSESMTGNLGRVKTALRDLGFFVRIVIHRFIHDDAQFRYFCFPFQDFLHNANWYGSDDSNFLLLIGYCILRSKIIPGNSLRVISEIILSLFTFCSHNE